MNSVARVFVVLNLLLAAGFLMAAATFLKQNDNYKADLETASNEHTSVVNDKNAEISDLSSQIQMLNENLNTKDRAITTVTGEKANVETRLAASNEAKSTAERDKTTLQGSMTGMQGHLAELKDRVGELDGLVERYRKESVDAASARDTAVTERTAAVKAQESAEKSAHDRQNKIDMLSKSLASTKDVLASYQAAYPNPSNATQPKINGHVTRFDADTNVVQVNRGKSQGVSLGHEFDIMRGGQYIATVEVDYVEDNSSIGFITLRKGNRAPRSGDTATKL